MVRTVDQYGPPSYGPIGSPVAGQVFHTPENQNPTLASAIAVAKWQASPQNTSGGSYHGIVGHDSVKFDHGYMLNCTDPNHWVMARTVPWNQCAGGVGNNLGASRHPWMKSMIHAKAYADPNKYFHQIALSGKAAQYEQSGYPKGLVTAVAMWVKILEDAYKYSAVLTLHRQWQTNRSDPGPANFAQLVVDEYQRLNAPPVVIPPPPVVVPPPVKTYTQAEMDAVTKAYDTRLFSKDQKIDSAIAMLQNAKETS